jgi:hypothetical protein
VDPRSDEVRRAIAEVRTRCRWEHAGQPFFEGEVEPCINGRTVTLGAYFEQDVDGIVTRLLREPLEDGGWNCEAPPSTVSSFHSTICVLEGLLAWEAAQGPDPRITAARTRAHEYYLERGLMRGRRSGEIVDRRMLRFGWHPNWEYDVLRGLDYFRAADARPDPRMADAIEVVRARAHQNGLWPLNRLGPGEIGYVTEAKVGGPSRWNTLRALRVLDWWGRA